MHSCWGVPHFWYKHNLSIFSNKAIIYSNSFYISSDLAVLNIYFASDDTVAGTTPSREFNAIQILL
ncbi:protein of unknown function [Tepidibacter aestuarii]|nr:protein of unknown function [Tepidibacter aestuarii]